MMDRFIRERDDGFLEAGMLLACNVDRRRHAQVDNACVENGQIVSERKEQIEKRRRHSIILISSEHYECRIKMTKLVA